MKKIIELAKLFAEYKTYPKSCYDDCSPVKVFQRMFSENHYGRNLETLLLYQNYNPTQRGADLPWWGKEFFSGKQGFRIMVVSQDTQANDAGSIVLAAHLFPVIDNFAQYQKFTYEMGAKKYFNFKGGYKNIKDQFIEWGINFDFLYVTDASKVYKAGSWKDRDFNKEKSKELLEEEIELCNPNLIILLGKQPLDLLDKTKNYISAVESGKLILIKDKKCVVAPFFIGNGPAGNRGGKGFKKRLEIAGKLVKNTLK